jgi:hypothetical protein
LRSVTERSIKFVPSVSKWTAAHWYGGADPAVSERARTGECVAMMNCALSGAQKAAGGAYGDAMPLDCASLHVTGATAQR